MKVGPICFLALLPALLPAQDQASVGVGLGVVRQDNGSRFSAFTLSPALQRLTPLLFLGASGGLSVLDSGAWASQGRADLWAARPVTPTTKLALNVVLSATTRSDGGAAGSGSALGEVVWAPPGGRGGGAIGAGPVTGVIENVLPVTALRLRARAWWLTPSSTQLSFSTEATRFLGAWYHDVLAGVSIDRPRTVAYLWVSGRASGRYGSSGAVSALGQYFVTPRLAIELSGGNYLRDPFQGLPRAGFGSLGVRLHTARREFRPPPEVPAVPVLQPLVAQRGSRGGDTLVVRFHMEAARTVAIAGSWNGWTPMTLQALGGDIWEAPLRLPPGTYYFNLIVDEAEWVVPGGVAVVSDGMGGLVAVLTVL